MIASALAAKLLHAVAALGGRIGSGAT